MTLTEVLNRQIADWTVMFVKLHNYHWYVTGEQFFTLHAKFEELYNEAASHLDALAERLLALGGKPVATLSDALAVASVKEARGGESAREMVQAVVDDFSNMVKELKTGMELAASSRDDTTGDLFLSILSSLEKHIWLLRAYLG